MAGGHEGPKIGHRIGSFDRGLDSGTGTVRFFGSGPGCFWSVIWSIFHHLKLPILDTENGSGEAELGSDGSAGIGFGPGLTRLPDPLSPAKTADLGRRKRVPRSRFGESSPGRPRALQKKPTKARNAPKNVTRFARAPAVPEPAPPNPATRPDTAQYLFLKAFLDRKF